ncbi:MAG: diaminopimelate epimerase [Puniceicoccales bacterium]|jgi:diaminopimelate epimerase|nr:diaminopimelate epimerase [Puniceicoccales bacterium]
MNLHYARNSIASGAGAVHFTKYHALGNSYLFLDASEFQLPASAGIRKICDGNFGLGSDGLLHGGKICDGNFSLRIFNPDGSEAEISGNGLRIFSRAMFDLGHVSAGGEFFVKTAKKNVACKVISTGEIEVDMGFPMFRDGNIPFFGEGSFPLAANGKSYECYPVSMGNPHCVIFTAELSSDEVRTSGKILEQNQMFPERTNVEFAKVIDRGSIEVEIWERGTGYTLACGSGACAVFAVAKKLDLCSDHAEIQMPGGSLRLKMLSNGSIIQTGPVERIASCCVDDMYLGSLEKK